MWVSCQLLLGFCITHINLLNHKHCSDSCGHHLGQDNEDCCQISGFKRVLDRDLQSRIKQQEVSWIFCVNRRMAGFKNHWFFSGSEENWSILATVYSLLVPVSFPSLVLGFFSFFRLLIVILIPHNEVPQHPLSFSPHFQDLTFHVFLCLYGCCISLFGYASTP